MVECGAYSFEVSYIRTNGYVSGAEYPRYVVISNMDELTSYYEDNSTKYDMENFRTDVARYDEAIDILVKAPEMGTCDMAEWHILVELGAEFTPGEDFGIILSSKSV